MPCQYGTVFLLMFLHTGTSLKGCADKCRSCKRGECFTCDTGFWGANCEKECSVHCLDRQCNLHSSCEKGCQEGWYGFTCEVECAHCQPGGCSMYSGYCKKGCLPDKCGPGCPCKKDKFDAEDYSHDVMDSIPNNIIAAFVIGVVFVVFIVFIFCGYTKCPEKDLTEERSSRSTRRTARRTASSTPSTMSSYPSNGRSDVTSPLYPTSAVPNSYRSNVASDAIPPPFSRAAGGDIMLNLSFDHPPPYCSLGPAASSPSSSEQPTPPPTYESLFPANIHQNAK